MVAIGLKKRVSPLSGPPSLIVRMASSGPAAKALHQMLSGVWKLCQVTMVSTS